MIIHWHSKNKMWCKRTVTGREIINVLYQTLPLASTELAFVPSSSFSMVCCSDYGLAGGNRTFNVVCQ